MTRLVFPVLLGAVVLVVVTAAVRLRGGRRAAFLRESAIVLSAYFVYFLIRGATEGRAAEAMARAQSLESLESKLGLLVEARLQETLLRVPGMLDAANAIYIWWHWPVIGLAGLWLYMRRHERYPIYRNTMLVSGAIGVVIFALFPTAPPRLANPDILDTVVEHSQVYRVMQPPPLTNQYAAIPSLHFGWNLLIGIALFRESRVLLVRAFGLLSPPLMLLATVTTGNHYVLDAVAGGALVLTSLWLVERASSGAVEAAAEAPCESLDGAEAVAAEAADERRSEPPPSGTRRR